MVENKLNVHRHHCPDCVYLGSGKVINGSKTFDYYYCPSYVTAVARYGSEDNEFYGGVWSVKDTLSNVMRMHGTKTLFSSTDLARKEVNSEPQKALLEAVFLVMSKGYLNYNLEPIAEGEKKLGELIYTDWIDGVFAEAYFTNDENKGTGISVKVSPNGNPFEVIFKSISSFAKDLDAYERTSLEHNEEVCNLTNFFRDINKSGIELPTINTFLWKAMVEAFRFNKVSFKSFYQHL